MASNPYEWTSTEEVKVEYLVVRHDKNGRQAEGWHDDLERAKHVAHARQNGPYGIQTGARFYVVKKTTTITLEVV